MNTVSDVLGNVGAPIQAVLHDGRIINVSRLDQAGKTRIEQHLKALAKSELMDCRHEFSDEEFGIAWKSYLELIASAAFKFGGGVYNRFLNSGSGATYIGLMLSKWDGGKDVTQDELIAVWLYEEPVLDDAGQPVLESGKPKVHRPDQLTFNLSVKQAIQESFPKG